MKLSMMRRLSLFALSLALVAFAAPKAYADCASPAGVEGAMVYNDTYNVVQFCDGTSWIAMGGTAGGGGIGLTDGDKGDVTVSGSGASWAIDSGAVTFGKMQTVNTNTLLGRSTAGTGIVEEITLGGGLTLTGGVLNTASGSTTGTGTAGYVTTWTSASALGTSSTAAGNQLFWDNTNHRLGIGTTTPTAKLDVAGNAVLTAASGNIYWQVTNSTVTADFGVLGTTGSFFGSNSNHPLLLRTNGTEKMRIDATGNVGIGVAPGADTKLDVGGDIRSTSWRTYTLTRTVPTTVNDKVDLGTFTFTVGTANLHISLVIASGGYSVAKYYTVPVNYSGTTAAWQTLKPLMTTGAWAGAQDADIDININTTSTQLRLRRSLGVTAGTATITIQQEGFAADVFTPSTATGSVTDPGVFYAPTVLTASAASNVTDGDKGDISVSSGVWGIDPGAVVTADIADDNVTFAKLPNMASSTLLGRGNGATGDPQAITLGSGLTMTGTVLSASGGGGGFWQDAGSNNISNTNTGNVGIGHSSPTSKLDVNGGIRLGNDAATCVVAKVGTLRFNTDNKMQICVNGVDGYAWTDLAVVSGLAPPGVEETPITATWPHVIACTVTADSNVYYFWFERAMFSTNKRRRYRDAYNNWYLDFDPSGAYAYTNMSAGNCHDKSRDQLISSGQAKSLDDSSAFGNILTNWPDVLYCTYTTYTDVFWLESIRAATVYYKGQYTTNRIWFTQSTGAFVNNDGTTNLQAACRQNIGSIPAANKFSMVGGPPTKSMTLNVPDALICTESNGDQAVLRRTYLAAPAIGAIYRYSVVYSNSSSNGYIDYYVADGQYYTHSAFGGSNCINKSLDQLRAAGQGLWWADDGTAFTAPPSDTPPAPQTGLPLSGDPKWPDYILCRIGGTSSINLDLLMYSGTDSNSRRYYYSHNSYYMRFESSGAYQTQSGGGGPISSSDCNGQSIQTITSNPARYGNWRDNVAVADMNFGAAQNWPMAIVCSDSDYDNIFRLQYSNNATYMYYYAHGVGSYYHSFTPGVGQNGTGSNSNAGNCVSPTNMSIPALKALPNRTFNWRGGTDTGSMIAGVPDALVCNYTSYGGKWIFYLWRHYRGGGNTGYNAYRMADGTEMTFSSQAPYAWQSGNASTDCANKSLAQLNATGRAVFLVETNNKDQTPGAYAPEGGSMVDGWPDAMLCRGASSGRPYVYQFAYQDGSHTWYYTGSHYYAGYYSTAYPSYMRWYNNKTYYDRSGDELNECQGLTIAELEAQGLAFNFGGGGGGSANTAKAGGVNKAIQFNDNDDLAGGNLFWDKVNNRMGIGTGTPGYTLDITVPQNATTGIAVINTDTTDSSSRSQLLLQAGTVSGRMLAAHSDAVYLGSASAHAVHLQINSANVVTLSTGSNVGIGTTTPQAKLDVAGGVKVGNDATCNASKYGTLRWTGTALEICTSGSWVPVDASNGGSTSSPWVTLSGTPGSNHKIYFNASGTGGALISSTGSTSVNASAAFEIDSTTKGFLPPRMTEAQRNAIASPATGLIIYNTSVDQLQYYAGGYWQQIGVIGTSNTAGTANNRLQFMGYGNAGAPGDGTSSNYSWPTLVSNASLNHTTITSFDAGGYGNASNVAACVLTNAGSNNMWCWGNSYTNINGAGSDLNLPSQITGYTWKQVSLGLGLMACGVTTANVGYCWGYQQYFGLGNNVNSGSYAYTPQAIVGVSPPGGWDHISVGGYYPIGSAHYAISCGISMTGNRLWCWGSDVWGQIGNGVGGANPTQPLEVTTNAGSWAKVRVGGEHVCAMTTSNQIYCWGYGGHGQVGNGAAAGTNETPTLITMPAGVTSWTDLESGAKHSCAIANTGSLYCWGQNNYGQIGDGTATQRNVPTLVVGGKRWTKVSVGDLLTCATDTNRRMYCWGYNAQGQIGNGTTTTNYLPQPVYGDDTVLDFSLGNYGSYRLVQ